MTSSQLFYVLLFFHFQLAQILSVSHLPSSFIHELFRSVLFCWQKCGNFPEIFLLLVFDSILLYLVGLEFIHIY